MIVLIGRAVGAEYSLFYIKPESEERAAGRNTLDAVEIAARTSGHSNVLSADDAVPENDPESDPAHALSR